MLSFSLIANRVYPVCAPLMLNSSKLEFSAGRRDFTARKIAAYGVPMSFFSSVLNAGAISSRAKANATLATRYPTFEPVS